MHWEDAEESGGEGGGRGDQDGEYIVNPWLIHVNVWQNPLQCCEVISLQLIKINEKKEEKKSNYWSVQKKKKKVYSCCEQLHILFLKATNKII